MKLDSALGRLKMIDDPVLLNDWHAVVRASELKIGSTQSAKLLDRELVIWRSRDGVHAWLDVCVHRGAKLSLGKVQNDCLICPYHGWTYDTAGQCTGIPAHPSIVPPGRAKTTVFQVREAYDLVWVC